MTAGNFLYLLPKPFARDTLLKFDRKKAIVSSRKNMDRDVGPAREAAGFAEHDLGFLRGSLRTGTQYVLRHVMQKVGSRIEFRRIAAARGSLFPRFDRACSTTVQPAVSSGFGIIALTNTTIRTGARAQTSGAVKPPSD